MTDPLYFKDHVDNGTREVPGIHDGNGSIQVKSFFKGLTTTGVNLHVWTIPPGATEGRHTHRADEAADAYEEIYYVLGGKGALELPDREIALESGDAVLVPVDVDHGLRSSGGETLRILLIYALPRTPSESSQS